MTLVLQNVTKQFGKDTAVDHLSLEIHENEMVGFVDRNGAGKTTTFRMLLVWLDRTEGDITWNGESVGYDKRHLIGYLPEERGLYPKLKVRDQLIYLAKLRGMDKKAALKELEGWLERLEVPEYMDKKVEE